MNTDAELLAQYAFEHSEAAFTELVRRNVDLIYSAALRLVSGDTHRAEDVTQQVFAELARQAQRLTRHPALTGWLYTTTRQIALRANRTRNRWQARELEANSMKPLTSEPASDPEWNDLRFLLDEAMHELGDKDRLAVLLRFFQNQNLKEVGAALGLNENAARMRVERALEKLRSRLARRGVTSTAAALVVVLTANAVSAAPPAFVATLPAASLAVVSATGGTTLAILNWISMTKLQAGFLGTVLIAGIATPLAVQHHAHATQRAADESLRQQATVFAEQRSETDRLSNSIARFNSFPVKDSDELQRLRDQVGALQRQTGELAALREEDRRLRASITDGWQRLRDDLEGPNGQRTEDSDELNARGDYCMRLNAGMRTYAGRHGGQYPTSLMDAYNSLSHDYWSRTNFANYSPDEFEIVYHGPPSAADDFAHPSDIILIREKRPWKNTDGKWVKVYSLLSGLGKTHSTTDGNFDAWEDRRIVRTDPSKE